jgi:outer membrane protein OmpA-like peptidoglycan-associated protein
MSRGMWRTSARLAVIATVTLGEVALLAGCMRRVPASAGAAGTERDETFEATTTEHGEVAHLVERFFFDSGVVTLSPDVAAAIARVAERLNTRRFRRQLVLVEGHSDSVGTTTEKVRLSTLRAEAIARVLIEHGVEASRVQTQGFGDTRPIAPERRADGKDSPEARARNRRVDIIVEDHGRRNESSPDC